MFNTSYTQDTFTSTSTIPTLGVESLNTVSSNSTNLFLSVGELLEQPDKDNWLIKGYLELDSTSLLYGSSGVGKSFVSVDIACSVATGTSWQGQETAEGAVFYIAGEGHSGFKKRFRAWQQENNVSLKGKPLFLSNTTIGLPDENNLENLLNNIEQLVKDTQHKPKLIILDTLARCLIGDENFAKDIGGFIQALDTIRKEYGCCVLTVHHTGHKEDRARGSSALRSAMDTELSLSSKAKVLTLSITKQKNHEPAAPLHFKLEQIDLGDEINSAVLTSTDKPASNHSGKLGKNEKILLDALKELEIEGRQKAINSENIAEPIPIPISQWRELAYSLITDVQQAYKKDVFKKSLDKLQERGLIIALQNEYYSLKQ